MTGFHQDKAWSRDKVPLLIDRDSSCLFYRSQSVGAQCSACRPPPLASIAAGFSNGILLVSGLWAVIPDAKLSYLTSVWECVCVGVFFFFFFAKCVCLCQRISVYVGCLCLLCLTTQTLVISNQEHEGIRVQSTTLPSPVTPPSYPSILAAIHLSTSSTPSPPLILYPQQRDSWGDYVCLSSSLFW